jgi:hypothetical protein
MAFSYSALALGAAAALSLSGGLGAAPADTAGPVSRTETMRFADCISLIEEISNEIGAAPAHLLRTKDVWLTRVDAIDGSVTITCNRPENRLTLKRVPRPAPTPGAQEGPSVAATGG